MSKFSIFATSLVLALAGFVLSAPVQAATYIPVTVRIETPDETIYNDTVYVADTGCTVTDSAAVEHQLTQPVAACALEAAAIAGDFKYTLDDSSYGLYLSAIKKIVATDTDYWLFDVNYQMASVGVADAVLTEGDDVLFTYGAWPNSPLQLTTRKKQVTVGQRFSARLQVYNDITAVFEPLANATVYFSDGTTKTTNAAGRVSYKPTATGTVTFYAEVDGYTRSNTGIVTVFARNRTHQVLVPATLTAMANKGADFLLSEINETGMIGGSQAITEWSAIALAATHNVNDVITKTVLAYEPTVNDGTTELARHILALVAIGQDPMNTNGVDYVARLKQTEHNNQFGSVDFVNDDIFAGLALLASGEAVDSQYVQYAVNAASAGINNDNGVSYAVALNTSDVDTTGYYLQLLQAVGGHGKVRTQAMRYLIHQQNLDGGFGYSEHSASNSSSTAVALQALGEFGFVIARNKRTGFNFLDSVQRNTGAFQYGTVEGQSVEQLNTAYAIPALVFQKLP